MSELSPFYYPPEWSEQEAVWFSWPEIDEGEVENKQHNVLLEMMNILIKYVNISVCIPSEDDKVEIMKHIDQQYAQKISFFVIKHSGGVWIRDFGPIFLKNDSNLKIAHFGWSNWGYINDTIEPMDLSAGNVCFELSKQLKIETIQSKLISEGGNREFNGKGIMMVTESVEVQRNPNMTISEMENEFKRVFGVKKVIWLKNGLANDQQSFYGVHDVLYEGKLIKAFNSTATGGHIDEFCRFLSPTKILLANIVYDDPNDPFSEISRKNMEENYQILKNETDLDGNPFEIIRISLPPTILIKVDKNSTPYPFLQSLKFRDGSKLDGQDIMMVMPSSYVNFVISNGVILLPKYFKEGRNPLTQKADQEAYELFKSLYPNYSIYQIDVDELNRDGGGMHCCTQQQPRV